MRRSDKLLMNDYIDKEEKLNEFKKDLIFVSFDQAKEKGKFKTDHKSVTKGRNALWSHYQVYTLCPYIKAMLCGPHSQIYALYPHSKAAMPCGPIKRGNQLSS